VICQLKVLKDEIKQFDLSLTCTEAYLDFSDTLSMALIFSLFESNLLEALRMIWSRKLFSLNKENALYQVIVSTRIKTSHVDYFKDMDNYFSQSIEAFRTDVHSEILKDLLQWISKVFLSQCWKFSDFSHFVVFLGDASKKKSTNWRIDAE
jgi:hypothetical protein